MPKINTLAFMYFNDDYLVKTVKD